MSLSDLHYLLALHSVEFLGPARIKKLFDYFGSFEAIWSSPLNEFSQFKFPENLKTNLKAAKKDLDPEKYWDKLQKAGINVITIFDDFASIPSIIPYLTLFCHGHTFHDTKDIK